VSSYYYIYGRSTGGFTGAELKQVVQEAALAALRADVNASHITAAHFKLALHKVSRVKLSEAQSSSAKPGKAEDRDMSHVSHV